MKKSSTLALLDLCNDDFSFPPDNPYQLMKLSDCSDSNILHLNLKKYWSNKRENTEDVYYILDRLQSGWNHHDYNDKIYKAYKLMYISNKKNKFYKDDLEKDMKKIKDDLINKFFSDLRELQSRNPDKIACFVLDSNYGLDSEGHKYSIICNYLFPDNKLKKSRIPKDVWINTRIQGSPMFARNIWYIGIATNLYNITMSKQLINKIGREYAYAASRSGY
jgi:hypothetical protein